MSQGGPQKEIQIETQGEIPWMTLFFIFGMVSVFAWMCTNRIEFWVPHSVAENWMRINSFQAIKVYQWWRDINFLHFWDDSSLGRLLTLLPVASLASFAGWQVIANCYFLWVFGAKVEQKLGGGRYVLLCILGMYIPWLALQWDRLRVIDDTYFYGPLFLISTVIGAAFLFPDRKEINTKWFKKTRGEIFQREESKDLGARWDKKNMQLFLCLYILFQVANYFFSDKLTPGFMTFNVFALLLALVLGYGVAAFLVWSATGSLHEGPVKLACIRYYNKILKLDVGHETAVKGTALALGLPEPRVREWVARQKGKIKIS
ncbi:MAG: rhomboid family intramembrane serine protease [Candidatus Obscuribacterales bacterium]|nr:rhomboid family intramembrane serine protease [Candidatus Obscuribacterales bacterium]